MLGVSSCKQSKAPELSPQEQQARRDSIAKATKDSVDQKLRSDSIAKAKADSTAKAKKLAELNIAKIYSAGLGLYDNTPERSMMKLGFKKGPKMEQEIPFGVKWVFYKNCAVNADDDAKKLLGGGTPVVVSFGLSENFPYGWIGVEVFDKDCLAKVEKYLKARDKGDKYGNKSYKVSKTKLGWFVTVDYPGM